jgi:hypothetical protein
MAHIHRLNFLDFEDREELMFSEFEESVAFAALHLLQIEDIFVKCDCLLDVVDFNCDMITTVDVNAHFRIYTGRVSGQKLDRHG